MKIFFHMFVDLKLLLLECLTFVRREANAATILVKNSRDIGIEKFTPLY